MYGGLRGGAPLPCASDRTGLPQSPSRARQLLAQSSVSRNGLTRPRPASAPAPGIRRTPACAPITDRRRYRRRRPPHRGPRYAHRLPVRRRTGSNAAIGRYQQCDVPWPEHDRPTSRRADPEIDHQRMVTRRHIFPATGRCAHLQSAHLVLPQQRDEAVVTMGHADQPAPGVAFTVHRGHGVEVHRPLGIMNQAQRGITVTEGPQQRLTIDAEPFGECARDDAAQRFHRAVISRDIVSPAGKRGLRRPRRRFAQRIAAGVVRALGMRDIRAEVMPSFQVGSSSCGGK